jgi:hypothetical protein
MTPHERMTSLAAAARREVPPAVDVTAGVRRIISQLPAEPLVVSARPLAWVAAAASVAAVIAVVAAFQISSAADSMTEITNSIAWVTK